MPIKERLTRPEAALLLFKDVVDIPLGDLELARVIHGDRPNEAFDEQEYLIEQMMLDNTPTRHLLEEAAERTLTVSDNSPTLLQLDLNGHPSKETLELLDLFRFTNRDFLLIGYRFGWIDSIPRTVSQAERLARQGSQGAFNYFDAHQKLLLEERVMSLNPIMRVYADIVLNHVRLSRARIFGPVINRAKIKMEDQPLGIAALTVRGIEK